MEEGFVQKIVERGRESPEEKRKIIKGKREELNKYKEKIPPDPPSDETFETIKQVQERIDYYKKQVVIVSDTLKEVEERAEYFQEDAVIDFRKIIWPDIQIDVKVEFKERKKEIKEDENAFKSKKHSIEKKLKEARTSRTKLTSELKQLEDEIKEKKMELVKDQVAFSAERLKFHFDTEYRKYLEDVKPNYFTREESLHSSWILYRDFLELVIDLKKKKDALTRKIENLRIDTFKEGKKEVEILEENIRQLRLVEKQIIGVNEKRIGELEKEQIEIRKNISDLQKEREAMLPEFYKSKHACVVACKPFFEKKTWPEIQKGIMRGYEQQVEEYQIAKTRYEKMLKKKQFKEAEEFKKKEFDALIYAASPEALAKIISETRNVYLGKYFDRQFEKYKNKQPNLADEDTKIAEMWHAHWLLEKRRNQIDSKVEELEKKEEKNFLELLELRNLIVTREK
jgi:hypothetical protein